MVFHMEIPVVKFSNDGHKFFIVKMSQDTRSATLVVRNGSPLTFASALYFRWGSFSAGVGATC